MNLKKILSNFQGWDDGELLASLEMDRNIHHTRVVLMGEGLDQK